MGKIRVEVCCGLHCSLKGGQEIFDIMESSDLFDESKFDVIPVNCLQCCQEGVFSPVVSIKGECYTNMTVERLISTMRSFIN
jgi:NADH:ubiquinone oxidoreductase subunit E